MHIVALYRRILRLAPSPEVRRYARAQFHPRTAIARNIHYAQQLLDHFTRLPTTPSLQAYYSQLSRYLTLSAKPPRPGPDPSPPPRKSTLTPGIVHATQMHPPFPRLKPQPEHLSMMIFNRRKAIQRNWDKLALAKEQYVETRSEIGFRARYGDRDGEDWTEETVAVIRALEQGIGKDKARTELRIPHQLREKAIQSNKLREARRRQKAHKV